MLIKSIGCPKSREHVIGVKVTYVPNPNPPPASSTASARRRGLLRQVALAPA